MMVKTLYNSGPCKGDDADTIKPIYKTTDVA